MRLEYYELCWFIHLNLIISYWRVHLKCYNKRANCNQQVTDLLIDIILSSSTRCWHRHSTLYFVFVASECLCLCLFCHPVSTLSHPTDVSSLAASRVTLSPTRFPHYIAERKMSYTNWCYHRYYKINSLKWKKLKLSYFYEISLLLLVLYYHSILVLIIIVMISLLLLFLYPYYYHYYCILLVLYLYPHHYYNHYFF